MRSSKRCPFFTYPSTLISVTIRFWTSLNLTLYSKLYRIHQKLKEQANKRSKCPTLFLCVLIGKFSINYANCFRRQQITYGDVLWKDANVLCSKRIRIRDVGLNLNGLKATTKNAAGTSKWKTSTLTRSQKIPSDSKKTWNSTWTNWISASTASW